MIQREMLIRCRDQFALYAQNHRAKISRFNADITKLDFTIPEQAKEIDQLEAMIGDTVRKAEANEQMVRDIQAVLDQVQSHTLLDTALFAKIVYADGITEKNQQTQLGVHFEEVAEMVEELASDDFETQALIMQAADGLENLAAHLKTSNPGLLKIIDRTRFLDAICDQLVTGTVGAVLYGMDPVAGLDEVNRSNFSKLTDGVMQKDPTTSKWIKGPNYTKPDLSPFV